MPQLIKRLCWGSSFGWARSLEKVLLGHVFDPVQEMLHGGIDAWPHGPGTASPPAGDTDKPETLGPLLPTHERTTTVTLQEQEGEEDQVQELSGVRNQEARLFKCVQV